MSASPADSRSESSPRRRIVLLGSLLIAAIGIAYANSILAPFIFDDAVAVTTNPTIRQLGWSILNPPSDGSTTTGRPLVNASYAFNYALSADHVWSYHALNIAIHACAALALFGIVRRTLRLAAVRRNVSFAGSTSPEATAFLISAMWALHPLQSETVVTIAQRTESLSTLLYLLTMYAFVRAADHGEVAPGRGTQWWLAVSWTACLLGMAAKEVMVTAPVMVLLYDRTFVAGSFRTAWCVRWTYYLALAATWTLLGALVLHSGGGRGASAGFGLGPTAGQYLLTQCRAILRYVALALWPYPLVLDYGSGVITSVADVAVQTAVLAVALAATAWALVRKPVVGFFGAAFFLLLAPSSSIVPLVTQSIAEHRMYLPLALFASGVAILLARAFSRPVWLLVGLVVAFAGTTIARNREYRDALTIWTANVARYPQGARGHNNLALALRAAGRLKEADEQFARAVALAPNYVTAHYDYGVALLTDGRFDKAIAEFQAAVALAPNHADAQLDLGNALVRAGRPADAIAHYEAALRIAPAPDVHYNLGVALVAINRASDAARHFQAAVATQPSLAPAHAALARLADDAGDTGTAEREYVEALRFAPADANCQARLGLLLAKSNRLGEAAEHLRAAVQLAPGDMDACANLGNVLLLQGRPREAVACYEEVLRRRPDDQRARQNLELARAALR